MTLTSGWTRSAVFVGVLFTAGCGANAPTGPSSIPHVVTAPRATEPVLEPTADELFNHLCEMWHRGELDFWQDQHCPAPISIHLERADQ